MSLSILQKAKIAEVSARVLTERIEREYGQIVTQVTSKSLAQLREVVGRIDGVDKTMLTTLDNVLKDASLTTAQKLLYWFICVFSLGIAPYLSAKWLMEALAANDPAKVSDSNLAALNKFFAFLTDELNEFIYREDVGIMLASLGNTQDVCEFNGKTFQKGTPAYDLVMELWKTTPTGTFDAGEAQKGPAGLAKQILNAWGLKSDIFNPPADAKFQNDPSRLSKVIGGFSGEVELSVAKGKLKAADEAVHDGRIALAIEALESLSGDVAAFDKSKGTASILSTVATQVDDVDKGFAKEVFDALKGVGTIFGKTGTEDITAAEVKAYLKSLGESLLDPVLFGIDLQAKTITIDPKKLPSAEPLKKGETNGAALNKVKSLFGSDSLAGFILKDGVTGTDPIGDDNLTKVNKLIEVVAKAREAILALLTTAATDKAKYVVDLSTVKPKIGGAEVQGDKESTFVDAIVLYALNDELAKTDGAGTPKGVKHLIEAQKKAQDEVAAKKTERTNKIGFYEKKGGASTGGGAPNPATAAAAAPKPAATPEKKK
ncbi:MAG: hypothetical protein LBB14_00190 [Puniceicoccales bacterium]|jgi:hypothetical protein|nr:hypothetical protein [Puniceicoccales bacterium]